MQSASPMQHLKTQLLVHPTRQTRKPPNMIPILDQTLPCSTPQGGFDRREDSIDIPKSAPLLMHLSIVLPAGAAMMQRISQTRWELTPLQLHQHHASLYADHGSFAGLDLHE